jgi:hypothetical protein
MVSHLLALLEGNGALVLQVALVSNEDSCDVTLRGVFLNLTHPGVDSVEGVAIGDVISDDDAVGALVVARCDRLKSLLASGVPNLKLANLVIAVNCSDLEVYADRGHEIFLKVVILGKDKRAE